MILSEIAVEPPVVIDWAWAGVAPVRFKPMMRARFFPSDMRVCVGRKSSVFVPVFADGFFEVEDGEAKERFTSKRRSRSDWLDACGKQNKSTRDAWDVRDFSAQLRPPYQVFHSCCRAVRPCFELP